MKKLGIYFTLAIVLGCTYSKPHKRQLEEKHIDRTSLTIGFILDSLIASADTSHSKGPSEIHDSIHSKSFRDALKLVESKKDGSYDWKYYTGADGKDYIRIRYLGCKEVLLTLKFYSDDIYIFTSRDVAFFIDTRSDMFLCFLPNVRYRLPSTRENSMFYLVDDNLYPIAACYALESVFVEKTTKIVKNEHESFEYRLNYTSLKGTEYNKLNYKDITQLKKETLGSSVILNGKSSSLGAYGDCNGPIWLWWTNFNE